MEDLYRVNKLIRCLISWSIENTEIENTCLWLCNKKDVTKMPLLIYYDKLSGLPLGGRTPYITSKNRLRTPKLHIRDVPRTSENSLVRPKMDIETSCLQKKPAHIYHITWFMSRLRIGNTFILFIDHARTSHLTDFESFIDSQCHV